TALAACAKGGNSLDSQSGAGGLPAAGNPGSGASLPGNITNLYAVPGNFQINLRWSIPAGAGIAGAHVVRKTGSFPASSSDGTILAHAAVSQITDTGLSNGTLYYYAVFSYDAANKYSTATTLAAMPYASGTALLSKTVTSAPNASEFFTGTTDAAGNFYAVGYQLGTSTYSYAAGVTAFGTNSGGGQYNPVLVKYNASGAAQWARSLVSGFGDAAFYSVEADTAGNIYAVGYQSGTSSFSYGSGVTAMGTAAAPNAVIVKYNSSGTALWVRTVTSGSSNSVFSAVTVDAAGNIYAAGYQTGFGTYAYAGGITVTGSASGRNAVLVKYNSAGAVQWAKTTLSGSTASEFIALKATSAGVFTAGYQTGTGAYNYGAGISGSGAANADNSVLVKYDTSGNAQWMRSIVSVTASNSSHFNAVVADNDGNIYCVGYQIGTGAYTYAVGVAATASATGANSVLVKYSADGIGQWVRATQSGSGSSAFLSAWTDMAGNIFTVGYQNGTNYFSYGGLGVSGVATTTNPVIVKFNSSGSAQWAQSLAAGGPDASFNSVSGDASGSLSVVGYQNGTGSYQYGIGVTMSGSVSGKNITHLKYMQ
ncbi:MAG: hypothetical protein J0L53_07865, partial [Spirochaetes bacterium]|nr:hypothetical protein [Spirochaetota bacterium]